MKLRDGSSKRVVTGYFATPSEALDAITKTVREAQSLSPERISVEQALSAWIAATEIGEGDTRKVRPKTLAVRRLGLATLLPSDEATGKFAGHRSFATLRNRALRDFDDAALRTFLERLRENGMAPRSLQQAYESLRAAYRWASRRRWVDATDSPFTRVSKPEYRAQQKDALTEAEIRRLLSAIRAEKTPRVRALLLLLVTTGLRLGEALGLRWEHVDLEGRVAKIRGQADAEGTATPLKTHESRRDVPLVPEVIDALNALGAHETGLVFTVASDKPLDPANVRTKYFNPMLKRAKLTESGLTPHGLRSIAATLLAAKVDPVTLTRLFGWSDGLKTALKYYVKGSAAMADEGRDAMIAALARLSHP